MTPETTADRPFDWTTDEDQARPLTLAELWGRFAAAVRRAFAGA